MSFLSLACTDVYTWQSFIFSNLTLFSLCYKKTMFCSLGYCKVLIWIFFLCKTQQMLMDAYRYENQFESKSVFQTYKDFVWMLCGSTINTVNILIKEYESVQ